MSKNHWKTCLAHLERELPADDFNIWIRPLQVRSGKDRTVLLAPNEYVRDFIALHHLERIRDIYEHLGAARDTVVVEVSRGNTTRAASAPAPRRPAPVRTGLDKRYQFSNFVQGKSNELAYAAAQQVARKPGAAYNPLLFYGGTGLGLSVSYFIITRNHKGGMSVESFPGKGTKFVVRLPLKMI